LERVGRLPEAIGGLEPKPMTQPAKSAACR
jgi:hypothetical protein